MSIPDAEKITYFQFASELDLPVFLGVHLGDFDSSLTGVLTQCGFTLMPQTDPEALSQILDSNEHARLLKLELAGHKASSQILRRQESDTYGHESLVPRDGYRVYRYKGVGLMLLSYGAKQWTLGVLPEFGLAQDEMGARSILNRYLSWALAPIGVAGFWGVPTDEAVVIAKVGQTQGEAVFFDLIRSRLISSRGVETFKSGLHLIRLDPMLKEGMRPIPKDEIVGFLSVHSSFFSLEGLSVPVRQMIQTMAKQFEAYRYPQDQFESKDTPRPEA